MENPLQGPSKIARIETTHLVETNTKRSWIDLPLEMLAQICIRLALIDFISFRGTCKYWRTASSTTTTQNNSTTQNNPWLLLYEKTNANTQTILCNAEASKKYKIDIPELNGANCLASYQGWILLHYNCGSLFFLSPFSRAKIELPKLSPSETYEQFAILSAPPTSEKCIICVINRRNDSIMDLHMLCRGDENWKKIEYPCSIYRFGTTVVGGIYIQGERSFYLLDESNQLLTYSDLDEKWHNFTIADVGLEKDKMDPLPFWYNKRYFRHTGAMRKIAELDDDVSVSTRGTVILTREVETIILNEMDNGSKTSEKSSRLEGIWVQPLFCQISSNQSWSLKGFSENLR